MLAFAAIAQNVNAATTRALADASAVYKGGEPFGVLFGLQPVNPIELVESAGPRASFEGRFTPGLVYADVLLINGEPFSVVGGLEPDSSGWLNVQLREVA
jgi:hypothetical protein